MVVIGSGSIITRLEAAGRVDENRLLTFPTAVGAGRRLFPDGRVLTLLSSEQVGPAGLTRYKSATVPAVTSASVPAVTSASASAS